METYEISAEHIYIVGCGGVASWLLPVLTKLCVTQKHPPVIVLIDGDKLEEKNLDRQLFARDQIGQFKSDALLARYQSEYPRLRSIPQFLTDGMEWERNSLFFGCADNHAARRMVLAAVDMYGGRAIIGGNEYTDAEAYVYDPEWSGQSLDPRKYYPEILTQTANDPTRPRSCTGIAAVETPQLVLANFAAANYMLWLFWFYYVERPRMDRGATTDFWPIKHRNTFSRCSTELIGQCKTAQPNTVSA